MLTDPRGSPLTAPSAPDHSVPQWQSSTTFGLRKAFKGEASGGGKTLPARHEVALLSKAPPPPALERIEGVTKRCHQKAVRQMYRAHAPQHEENWGDRFYQMREEYVEGSRDHAMGEREIPLPAPEGEAAEEKETMLHLPAIASSPSLPTAGTTSLPKYFPRLAQDPQIPSPLHRATIDPADTETLRFHQRAHPGCGGPHEMRCIEQLLASIRSGVSGDVLYFIAEELSDDAGSDTDRESGQPRKKQKVHRGLPCKVARAPPAASTRSSIQFDMPAGASRKRGATQSKPLKGRGRLRCILGEGTDTGETVRISTVKGADGTPTVLRESHVDPYRAAAKRPTPSPQLAAPVLEEWKVMHPAELWKRQPCPVYYQSTVVKHVDVQRWRPFMLVPPLGATAARSIPEFGGVTAAVMLVTLVAAVSVTRPVQPPSLVRRKPPSGVTSSVKSVGILENGEMLRPGAASDPTAHPDPDTQPAPPPRDGHLPHGFGKAHGTADRRPAEDSGEGRETTEPETTQQRKWSDRSDRSGREAQHRRPPVEEREAKQPQQPQQPQQ
eukprot:Sspe_Gene.68849::Locus_40586_Transcript_1_1_Confidence_1.000_Length_1814::g.68849::m.68849